MTNESWARYRNALVNGILTMGILGQDNPNGGMAAEAKALDELLGVLDDVFSPNNPCHQLTAGQMALFGEFVIALADVYKDKKAKGIAISAFNICRLVHSMDPAAPELLTLALKPFKLSLGFGGMLVRHDDPSICIPVPKLCP